MKTPKSGALVILGILMLLYSGLIHGQEPKSGDGKLTRGELWQPYVVTEQADFYVASNGNDVWSGTLKEPNAGMTDGPFLTIRRAQEAVRMLKSEVFLPKDKPVETRWIGSPHPFGKGKDITVLIRGGYYTLYEPLIFGPEDGGERVETNLPSGAFEYHKLRDHYVTYASYPGERAIISGGPNVGGWKKKQNVWVTQLQDTTMSVLIADGKKMTLTRTPNEGYFVPPVVSETTDVLHFNPGELRSWKNMENNRVHMLLRWHDGHNSFSSIDEKTGIARLAAPQEGVVIVPPRYYVENIKALMDSPGEWYFDRKSMELSFMPPADVDPATANIILPRLSELLVVKGQREKPVRNLRIYGLTFEGIKEGKSAISYEYAHASEFVGNELRAAAGTGITLVQGCYQTRILNNVINGIENMAILLNGPADPASGKDILRETWISHNHISDCGGINIHAAYTLYTTISHNYITRTRGRYAISVGGWANLEEAIDGAYTVEYNHLDNVQKDADDSGAIKTAGTTFNSVVRNNLIHDVRAGYFNDNVAFWFDNMSLGWEVHDNIYYNLEQAEMKLCAAYQIDNAYSNNYVIKAPVNKPETFINGTPALSSGNLNIKAPLNADGSIPAGASINVTAIVYNSGATGLGSAELYLDGKVHSSKSVPIVAKNSEVVQFELRLYDEGKHSIAIGNTEYQEVQIKGVKPTVVFENLSLSDSRILKGEKVMVTATALNLTTTEQAVEANLFIGEKQLEVRKIQLAPDQQQEVKFTISPEVGSQSIRIGNSNTETVLVQDYNLIDVSNAELAEYCSAKAKPYEIDSDQKANKFRIQASGSDFYHAEDSYASVFLKDVKGDFVATVKIREFGERTHEWFRAGLFARNAIAQSFDTKPGSKGSFLMFGTPGRAGVNYDEFANGCMHKASSQNLPEDVKFPIWLKLERHGDSFVGSVSLDGEHWINERRSGNLPGLEQSIDLGLAAGSCDKIPYWVAFEEWNIKVAK